MRGRYDLWLMGEVRSWPLQQGVGGWQRERGGGGRSFRWPPRAPRGPLSARCSGTACAPEVVAEQRGKGLAGVGHVAAVHLRGPRQEHRSFSNPALLEDTADVRLSLVSAAGAPLQSCRQT